MLYEVITNPQALGPDPGGSQASAGRRFLQFKRLQPEDPGGSSQIGVGGGTLAHS